MNWCLVGLEGQIHTPHARPRVGHLPLRGQPGEARRLCRPRVMRQRSRRGRGGGGLGEQWPVLIDRMPRP